MRFKTFLSIGVIFLLSSVLALAALDLRFTTAISQAPNPANLGDTVTFTVTLISDGAIVNDLKLIGGVDGAKIVEKIFTGIANGGTRTQSMSWTATGGAHTVWFELDPDHLKNDSNYGNNRVEKAITVSGGGPVGQPDLTPGVTYSPDVFNTGNAVNFSIIVNNNGTAASAPCDMILKKDGSTLEQFAVPLIGSGGQWQTSYSWNAKCDAGIEIIVDSNNANAESNEGNNTWSKQMACSGAPAGLPDLAIGVTFSPLKFDTGEDVTFTIKIDNKGTASAPSSQVIILVGMVGYKPPGIPALNPGGHYEFSTKIQFMCDAQFEIAIDYENEIQESNENNNKWLRKMTCGRFYNPDSVKYKEFGFARVPPADAPDLTILSVKRRDNVPLQYGTAIDVEVENIGLGKSNPCTLVSTTEDIFPDVTMNIPALEKGAKYTAKYVQKLNCGGTMNIKVDANNKNREINEENNTAKKSFLCLDLK
jgi:subtilase family serine protease